MINLQSQQKRILWLMAGIVIALFAFTRLYKLDQTLLFFGDPGRDFYILRKWELTGTPPLLGPQTSALPFNQSAVYFYLQYPVYLLTNGSEFTTIYTLVLIYSLVFIWGMYVFRKEPKLQFALISTAVLFIVHPQMIAQQRYVWNPSYLPLFLSVALFSYYQLLKSWKFLTALIFGFALAGAVSFSYSAAPVVIVMLLASFFWFPLKRSLQLAGTTVLGGLFFNAPTLFFELRHNFLLTNMMLHREKLAQEGADIATKLAHAGKYLLAPSISSQLIGLSIFVVSLAVGFSLRKQYPLGNFLTKTLLMALLILFVTLVSPVSLHAHYIFGIFTFFVVAVAVLPYRISAAAILLLCVLWFTPLSVKNFLRPAFRSVVDTNNCAQKVCADINEPVFVSTQAGFHPYHNGFEWLYQFSKAGCTVHEIDFEPQAAEKMLVVVDDSSYTHGETAYNELSLFGNATESAVINCLPRLEVHVLDKIMSEE